MEATKPQLERVAELLETLREQKPLVHCMTNTVVTGFTANILLALGAAPAMIDEAEEAEQFAGMANALLVNIGTLTHSQADAMRRAIGAANSAGRPWVLDPVAIGVLEFRTRFANEIKQQKPTIIRGNASEILALAGFSSATRGVDSGDSVEHAAEAAQQLAQETQATVLVTGETDCIATKNHDLMWIANGHPCMTHVTGVGCSQGALLAAFAAVAANAHEAALAGAVVMGLAGEMAAETTTCVGSYAVALLNALEAIDRKRICSCGRIL